MAMLHCLDYLFNGISTLYGLLNTEIYLHSYIKYRGALIIVGNEMREPSSNGRLMSLGKA